MNLLEYIIYEPLPSYYKEAYNHNKKRGWDATELTPDNYDITTIKAFHCPFKHIREITIPKIDKLIKQTNINGFLIIEGDVKINIDYQEFLNMNIKEPTWLGYKKKLSDYIVGNFLVYIPIKFYPEFRELVLNQKRKIYSDRFFTRLYFNNWLKLNDKSIAEEIPHHSNVLLQHSKGATSWRE